MAKRFTDSRKWSDPWFRRLPSAYRWLWIYILDSCSHIGIWKVDMDLASFNIGEQVTETESLGLFNGRIVVVCNDKWFIPKFLVFQYGILSPEGRLHQKIIKDLESTLPISIYEEYILSPTLCQQGVDTLKDKDKEHLNIYKEHIREIINDFNSIMDTQYTYTNQNINKMIASRMQEGATVDQFKKVHRVKYEDWAFDDHMAKYLRPTTLYRPNNFETYLNQVGKKKTIWDTLKK